MISVSYRVTCVLIGWAALAFAGARFQDHPSVIEMTTGKTTETMLRTLLSDVGDGNLTWEVRSLPPSWANVDIALEKIIANPKKGDAGDHEFMLLVRDGSPDAGDLNKIMIRVKVVNSPPRWTQIPLKLGEIPRGKHFNFDLKPYVTDADFDPPDALSFTLVDGPNWISVSDGVASGIPPVSGAFQATFSVSDGFAQQNNLGQGTVIAVPYHQVDDSIKANQGARAEVLWAIEHGNDAISPSQPTEGPTVLAYMMKRNIKYFFDKIKGADIHLTSALFKTEGTFSQGDPILGEDGNPLMTWNHPDPVADFNFRLSRAFFMWPYDNTPIVILQRFFERAPSMTDIFEKGIMDPGVPLYLFVGTTLTDFYKYFVRNTSFADYAPADFGKYFLSKTKKKVKFFSIGPSNWKTVGGASKNVPRIVAETMNGRYHNFNALRFNLKTVLESFANQIIIDNAITYSEFIYLDHKPHTLLSIRVKFKGALLSSDRWHYNSEKVAIAIHWELFDLSQVHPGDLFEIDYEI